METWFWRGNILNMIKEEEPKDFLKYVGVDAMVQMDARGELNLDALQDALKNKKITKESFDRLLADYTRRLELDGLTELLQQRFLRPKLKSLLTELKKSKTIESKDGEERRANELAGLVIIFIDLDNFKKYNDVVGHSAGDDMLRDFAARLRKSSRSYDLFFRNGGDEFFVIKPIYSHENMTREQLEVLVQKTKADVNGGLKDVPDKDGSTFNVSASMGSTIVLREDDLDDITESKLIEAADAAMYKDKGKKAR